MASRLALSALRQPGLRSRLALSALRQPGLRRRPQLRRGIVAEAAQLMCAAQDMSHLPWWATITTTTIAARLALTPTTILARRAGRRLAVAAPHARRLTQLAVESIKANPAGRVEAARLYATGLHGLLKLHRANPLLVALPLAGIITDTVGANYLYRGAACMVSPPRAWVRVSYFCITHV